MSQHASHETPMEPGDLQHNDVDCLGTLVGRSREMRAAFDCLRLIAARDATALIEGETGTGKEGAARAIHELSERRNKPFMVVDCGSQSDELVESSFFGHERGAFTGAHARRIGAFEAAEGGTIFLDEIGELPMTLQTRLLRVLEENTVQRVGGHQRRHLDVRWVAATHRDLWKMSREGTFRSDLYFRLNVLKVRLPTLRERPNDLPTLVDHLLERMNATSKQRAFFGSPKFLEHVQAFPWPGNVRELANYLERCLAMNRIVPISSHPDAKASRKEPTVDQSRAPLPASPTPAFHSRLVDPAKPYAEARQEFLARFERAYARALLNENDGNVSQSARKAGMNRVYLHRLLRRHGLRAASD